MRRTLHLLLVVVAALTLYCCSNPKPTENMDNVTAVQDSCVMVDDSTVNGLITHELLDEFSHGNIDGDHVSGGKRYTGAKCRDNSGAFAWFDDTTWEFINGEYGELLDSVAQSGGMGFGQAIIIHDGVSIRPLWREGVNQYRALCEKDGRLCIVDSRDSVEYEQFVAMLEEFAPLHALYMDMGAGWNHSWWRDSNNQVHELHPVAEKSRYCTNWITFYK